MARVTNGFLGDMSGSVGNITFARARGGIATARVRAKPGNPRSLAQQQQRGRFKQLQRFASAFMSARLIRPFWRVHSSGRLSAYNQFIRSNAAAMSAGLDPALAVLSKANGLAEVTLTAALPAEDGTNTLLLSVESTAGGDDADFLVGVLYHAGRWQAVVADTGATRGNGTIPVPVPAAWMAESDALFAYAFAYKVGPTGLQLSASSAWKVTEAPFVIEPPDVPAPASDDEAVYGQG